MKTVSRINPIEYTADVREQFSELIFHLHEDVSKVADAKGRSLFKVAAKAITRLQKAFTDYEERMKKRGVNDNPSII